MPSHSSSWRNGPKRIGLGLLLAMAGSGACAMAQVPGQTSSIETGGHHVVVRAAGPVDHTLLVDGRVVLHDTTDEFVALRGPYVSDGKAYVLIDENAGGNACEAQFQAVEIRPTGTAISPVFGNCSDAPVVSVRNGALHVTTPAFRGPYRTGFPFIAAESVTYRDGTLVRDPSK